MQNADANLNSASFWSQASNFVVMVWAQEKMGLRRRQINCFAQNMILIISLCAQFKFFSLFCSNDILTITFNFFYIPAKLISRKVNTWSLIPTPFDIKIAFQRKVYSLLESVGASWSSSLVSQNSDPNLSYIKGCRSIS